MKTLKILGVLLALVVGTLTVNAQTKTYNSYGVSFTYPSFLNIVGEEYSGNELNVALSSKDQMSEMFIAVSDDYEMIESIENYGLEAVLNNIKSQMVGGSAKLGTVKKYENSVTLPFTMKENGVSLSGEVTLSYKNDVIILTMIVAPAGDKFNAVKQATKSIKVS